jgi:hypothetical protein
MFLAKIDTGAVLSSIDKSIVNNLKIRKAKGKVKIKQAGKVSLREVCKLKIKIKDKVFYSWFTISDRKNMKEKILIGQNILKNNFLIRP